MILHGVTRSQNKSIILDRVTGNCTWVAYLRRNGLNRLERRLKWYSLIVMKRLGRLFIFNANRSPVNLPFYDRKIDVLYNSLRFWDQFHLITGGEKIWSFHLTGNEFANLVERCMYGKCASWKERTVCVQLQGNRFEIKLLTWLLGWSRFLTNVITNRFLRRYEIPTQSRRTRQHGFRPQNRLRWKEIFDLSSRFLED